MQITYNKEKDYCYFISRYEEKDIIKSYGAIWDKSIKCWKIKPSLLFFDMIKSEIDSGLNIKINEECLEWINSHKSIINIENKDYQTKMVPFLHQKNMADFFISKKQCFFFCEVGTGKSLSALMVASKLNLKTLIVCPATLLLNWEDEICKHISNMDYIIVEGTRKKRSSLLKVTSKIHIISYNNLDYHETELINNNYHVLIADEIHYAKNRITYRSKSLFKIAENIPYKIGLTGTSIANGYEDLFMLFKIINKNVFGERYNLFANKYIVKGGYQGKQVVSYNNINELKQIISEHCIVYKLEDVSKYVPKEVEIVKRYQLSDRIAKLTKELKDEMLIEINNNIIEANNVLTRGIKFQQLCSGFIKKDEEIINIDNSKINLLFDIIEEIDGKVIVWCRFINSIVRIMDEAKKRGIDGYMYYGETEDKGSYKKFNEDNSKLWVAQIQTGVGYSIPAAKHAIFFETDYSRINHTQAKGRNRRLVGGDDSNVIYTYLIGKNSIEEVIFNALKDKDFIANDMIDYIKNAQIN